MILLAVIGFGLVACGGDDDDDTTSPPPEVPDVPDDADAVVAQFTSGGGIAGPCCDPWVMPELTVYGDGRVVVAGDPAREAQVRPADVAALLADAAESGLLDDDPPDTGTLCCDLGDTIIVLTDVKATHQMSIIGLGAEGNANAELTTEQRAVRQAALDLRSGLDELVQESDEVRDYAPKELAAYVFPGEAGPGVEVPPWPLEGSLAEGCTHVTTGADTVLADAEARDDDAGTTWTSAGRPWRVILRPLLPHEHACPATHET